MKFRFLTSLIIVCAAIIAQATTPKYIFYFIGDGMGPGAVSVTEAYRRMVLGLPGHLNMLSLPVASTATTYSASSPVTDSAAAGTALSSGHKTTNGMLGMTPDSTSVVSMAETLHNNGFGIGLVTSVAPDDATPAAFYAHRPHRSMYYEIGLDAAASGYEFIAGGNLRGLKDKNGTPTDLMATLRTNEVAVVRGLEELKETTSRKVLLLNTDTTDVKIAHAIDSIESQLTLSQMTQACLDHLLTNSPDRFFMMVEGGSIDHAAHANDAATVVIETLAFDKALGIAIDFYRAHPDETLIVVTADHETGGMIFANQSMHYFARPDYLKFVRQSKDRFTNECKAILHSRRVWTWDDMKQYLSDNMGLYTHIPVSEADDATLQEKFQRTFELRNSADKEGLYNSFNEFSVGVFDLINRAAGIGWVTGDHSGTIVPVYAAGVGAYRFAPMQDNTEIPQKILRIAGF